MTDMNRTDHKLVREN